MSDQDKPARGAGPDRIPSSAIETADALRVGVTRMARQLRRLRSDHGISAAKLGVLGQLYRADQELTAVDLARQDRLQPQSLTRNIAELEERGLIARRPGKADRREMLIRITDQGRALLAADARQQVVWLARQVDSRLTGTEQALLHMAAGLLARLAEGE